MITEFERAVQILNEILPTVDSWADAPADSYAVVEHTETTYFYEDNEPADELLKGQFTIWIRDGQQALQQYVDECSDVLASDGWTLGLIQAENVVVNGTPWFGQTRGITFLRG